MVDNQEADREEESTKVEVSVFARLNIQLKETYAA